MNILKKELVFCTPWILGAWSPASSARAGGGCVRCTSGVDWPTDQTIHGPTTLLVVAGGLRAGAGTVSAKAQVPRHRFRSIDPSDRARRQSV
jgi:hypothetical protein